MSAVVEAGALRETAEGIFAALGFAPPAARRIAGSLVDADLRGVHSHGVMLLPLYADRVRRRLVTTADGGRVAHDNGAVAIIDGERAAGQLVAHQAMELAIERARQHGVCVMGLRNSHHIGRVGHWAEQAIAAGMVSIHFTNANSIHVVAPHGGAEARFVTNPFTVGIPRRTREPLLLDFATSAIAHGKARVAYNKKVPVPPGCLIDDQGRPTTDPAVVFESPAGALLTFAGHKGYALAMVCEMLGAALTGGDTSTPVDGEDVSLRVWNSMLAIVFDPARLGSTQEFEQRAAEFEDWVRSARPAPGSDGVRMPGDPEREYRKARAGGIVIDAQTVAQMDEAARQVSAALPRLASIAR